ncbi:hypothetical protein L9F63_022657 [Diploptera punctata]|uniref:Endonuclease-reverse transcriptase n=1 Tax=Diploptera punctata TaxID=6984 RepID=A0AAD7ZLP1_DIPPU|nr:hypothetical protein L9F63_022657 [Diploptera punctata]
MLIFKLYTAIIRPIICYGAETWVLKEADKLRLLTFERKIFRRVLGPVKENGNWRLRRNDELYLKNNKENIVSFIKSKRLQWFGHTLRMPKGRLPNDILNWKPQGTRARGRPKDRWEDDVIEDLREMGIFDLKSTAQDRKKWRKLVEKAKTFHWKS